MGESVYKAQDLGSRFIKVRGLETYRILGKGLVFVFRILST